MERTIVSCILKAIQIASENANIAFHILKTNVRSMKVWLKLELAERSSTVVKRSSFISHESNKNAWVSVLIAFTCFTFRYVLLMYG